MGGRGWPGGAGCPPPLLFRAVYRVACRAVSLRGSSSASQAAKDEPRTTAATDRTQGPTVACVRPASVGPFHRDDGAVSVRRPLSAAAFSRRPCPVPRVVAFHRGDGALGAVRTLSRASGQGTSVEGPHFPKGRHRLPCEAPSALSVKRPWPRRREAPPLPRRACGRRCPSASSCPGLAGARTRASPRRQNRGAKIHPAIGGARQIHPAIWGVSTARQIHPAI